MLSRGKELTLALDVQLSDHVHHYSWARTWKHRLDVYTHELAHAALLRWPNLPLGRRTLQSQVARSIDDLSIRTQNVHEVRTVAVQKELNRRHKWRLYWGVILESGSENILEAPGRTKALTVRAFENQVNKVPPAVVARYADKTERFLQQVAKRHGKLGKNT